MDIEVQESRNSNTLGRIYTGEKIDLPAEDSDSESDGRSSGEYEETNYLYGHENADEFPDGGAKAYSVLLGATLGLIADYGIPNSTGAIETYLINHQFKGQSSAGLSWMFAIYMFLMYLLGVVSGTMFDIAGPRLPMAIGSILIVGGLLATGSCTELWQFYLAFAVLVGIGCSFCMSPLIGSPNHYFLKKRGLTGGISTVGGCIGGVIFPLILNALFIRVGFAWTMRIFALINAVLLGSAFLLLDSRLPTKELDVTLSVVRRYYKAVADNLDFSLLKDKKFLWLTFGILATELNCINTGTYLGSYAISTGFNESQALILLTILNASSIPSRIIGGTIADRYGRFNVMCICCFMQNFLCWVVWFPLGQHHAALYVFTVVYGVFQSALLALLPACCGQICKAEQFGQVFGAIYFGISGANLVGLGVSGVIIGKGGFQNYKYFVMYTGLVGICGVIGWFMARFSIAGFKRVKV